MQNEASREILWNVNSWTTVVGMYSIMVISMIIAGAGIFRRAEIWKQGKPSAEGFGSFFKRALVTVRDVGFQHRTNRERVPGVFHTLIYVGFMVLLFTTTMVFIDHDLGIRIYKGDFYLFVTLISDIFGLGFLLGLTVAWYRRAVTKPDLLHTKSADKILLLFLALLIIQGFILEGLRIHVTDDPWKMFSPIGYLVALFFWSLTPESARVLHKSMWWFHTITVFAGVALIPYTKLFHILVSSANIFFERMGRPRGALEFPGDLEKLMETSDDLSLGTSTIKDYNWKQLLDLDACTSCGRCQDVCPAYISGKPLSPKWLILDTRNHTLALTADGKLGSSILPKSLEKLDAKLTVDYFLQSSGVVRRGDDYGYEGERAKNQLVQNSVISIGGSADQRIAGEVMDQSVFWSCNTCMACVEVCPVGINHVDHIISNRRSMVLMHGEIPVEAQKTLRTLESVGNPYGDPSIKTSWLSNLDVKVLEAGDSVDYLYWVGCVSSFDQRKQKIAESLVKIMNRAGLDFGILGSAEGCSGDPARRLGEENLFQALAKGNIELLKSLKFKYLVANCPHCFNTIKNEYPQLGNLGDGRSPEIIHHSVLLRRLIDEGCITLTKQTNSNITFHDPCYLGRHNGEYEAPRSVMSAVSKLPILEMENSKEKGLCCGAGGGHYWMDLKIGERVNTIRVDQASKVEATEIATACPFCMQMMEDGVTLTNRESNLRVRDIAEFVADSID